MGFRSIGIGRFVSFCYLRVTLSHAFTLRTQYYVVSIIYVI